MAVCPGEAGLYLHLPFCARKCGYCDFYSRCASQADRERYGCALLRELDRQLATPEFCDTRFSSVYLGGGTPSLMPLAFFEELFASGGPLQNALQIGCEITIEMNPESADPAQLRCLPNHTRVRCSLGVQSTHPHFLQLLDRHRTADLKGLIHSLRAVRPIELGLDLISQLPGESLSELDQDLDALLALQAEHLSVYGLGVEEGTPLADRVSRGEVQPLSSDEAAGHYLHVSQRLRDAGYLHYEVANFCKPGCVSRHNTLYWRGLPWLGLGAGASSQFSEGRTLCLPDWEAFCVRVEQGLPPALQEEARDPEQMLLEEVYTSLRWIGGLRWHTLEEKYGFERIRQLRTRAAQLLRPSQILNPKSVMDGLSALGLSVDPEGIDPAPVDLCLSPQGWLLLDELVIALMS